LAEVSSLSKGDFTIAHVRSCKNLVNGILTRGDTDDESINMMIDVTEKLVTETTLHKKEDRSRFKWVLDKRYFNPVLSVWKRAAVKGRNVYSPEMVLKKFNSMAEIQPDFRYDIMTLGIITHVMIMKAEHTEAPLVAQKCLDLVKKEGFKPDSFIYSQLLQAWCSSFRPDAADEIEAVIQKMDNEGIPISEVCWNIILKFWSRIERSDKVEETWNRMAAASIKPSMWSCNHALHAYARIGNIVMAEVLLKQMCKSTEAKTAENAEIIYNSLQGILMAYRRIIANPEVDRTEKKKAVAAADSTFRYISGSSIKCNSKIYTDCMGTMMDIFGIALMPERVEALALQINMNTVHLNILIKSFGMADVSGA
jgi:pentatricopeptide repeat protein